MARLKLQAMLKRKKLSKRQFALRMGMPYPNVFRLFRPQHNPRLSDLTRYAAAIGCKVRDLIEG